MLFVNHKCYESKRVMFSLNESPMGHRVKIGQHLGKRVKPFKHSKTRTVWILGVHPNLLPLYLRIFMHLGYLNSTYTYYLFWLARTQCEYFISLLRFLI
jgi:hypothetical protein